MEDFFYPLSGFAAERWALWQYAQNMLGAVQTGFS